MNRGLLSGIGGRVRRGVLLQAAAQGLEEKQVRAVLQGKIALPHALPKQQ